MTETNTTGAPLAGIVVVALEAAVSAPFATRQLADLGATIIKVERRDGGDFARDYDTTVGGSSAFFVWANRGKQSIQLDVKDDEDRKTFDALIAGADVFIQNLSPAAAARLGITADQLREVHPQLISCDISGYGTGGPRTDDKAYDLAIQAEAGAIALTGSPEEASKVGVSIADISAAMYALSSILAALYRRETSNVGASIEVSMLESLAEWTAPPTYAAVGRGSIPERSARRHTMIAPYGLQRLADGTEVLIAVQSNRDWSTFAEQVLLQPALIRDPRFADNGDRIANVDELDAVIAAVFEASTPDAVRGRLRASGIAHSSVRDAPGVWNHEQLRARDRFMEVTTPTGTTETYRPPFNISGLPIPGDVVPTLGQHDEQFVADLVADHDTS